MSQAYYFSPLDDPSYGDKEHFLGSGASIKYTVNGPQVRKTNQQWIDEDTAYFLSLPDSEFNQMTEERDASLRAAYAAFGGIAVNESPYAKKEIKVEADVRIAPLASYPGQHVYECDNGSDDSTSEIFTSYGSSRFRVVPGYDKASPLDELDSWSEPDVMEDAGGVVPQTVSIELATPFTPAKYQLTDPLPCEAVHKILSQVGSSFKVAKSFVPIGVSTPAERLTQLAAADLDPCTLGTGLGRGAQFPGELPYSFPEATDTHREFDDALDTSAYTIASQASSPGQAYERLMISKFGFGGCTVLNSLGEERVIYDYQTINAHSYFVHFASADGDSVPDHFVAHFLGLLPPRRLTTYTEGLLRLLTNNDPSRSQETLTYEGVPRTVRTGPHRTGHRGGCLLDSYGNLVGFVSSRIGIPCLNLWSQKHQAWYSSFPCTDYWERWPHSHRSLSLSTPNKMAGVMVDIGTYGCDQECCSRRYFRYPMVDSLPGRYFTWDDSHAWYHRGATKCTCVACIGFRSGRSPDPAAFIRLTYQYQVHAALLDFASKEESAIVRSALSCSAVVPQSDEAFYRVASKYLVEWNVHSFTDCAGGCAMCRDARDTWLQNR